MDSLPASYDKAHFEIASNGLTVTGEPTFDEWLAFGDALLRMKSALQFAIGDWINYGEHRYGEKYDQAMNNTAYEYGTLRNYASVAAAYPDLSHRMTSELSWSHHAVVASVPVEERQKLLETARDEKLNREELRDLRDKQNPGSTAKVQFLAFDGTFQQILTNLSDYLIKHESMQQEIVHMVVYKHKKDIT